MTDYLLAIDPGLHNLGWAFFTGESELKATGSYVADTSPQLSTRLIRSINQFGQQLGDLTFELTKLSSVGANVRTVCIIEEPHEMGTFKATAAQHASSLGKLYMYYGALLVWAQRVACFDEVWGVKVRDYKGQLPKEICARRMKEKYKRSFPNLDISDAVYLGDWYYEKGRLALGSRSGELK